MVCSLEEVNRLDNSTNFKAFDALVVSEKKLLFITEVLTAHSLLRLSRRLSIGEGRLLGRLSRPKAESEGGFGNGAVNPLRTS